MLGTQWDRSYATSTGADNVYDALKFHVAYMVFAVFHGMVETLDIVNVAVNKVCTLHKEHFFGIFCNALFNGRNIVNATICESFVFKPTAAECVTCHEKQQRVKSHRFKAGGIKHRKVKTSAHFLLQDLMRQAYPLTYDFIACRGIVVDYFLLNKGGKNCCHLKLHVVWVVGLIACERGVAFPLFQERGSVMNNWGERRVIWCNKCGYHLRHYVQTAPLIAGEKLYSVLIGEDIFAILKHLNGDIAHHFFCKREKKICVGRYPHGGYFGRTFCGDRADIICKFLCKLRLKGYFKADILKDFL